MKYATLTARFLLAAIFIVFSLNFWLNFIKAPLPPADSAPGIFFGVIYTTGYLAAVKVLELTGGLLVASGRFLGAGLLILGPIILNILFFDIFLAKAFNPVSTLAAILALFLLWTKRERFIAFATA
jgi:putative oxidoreductase